jgi:hypothetical protein
MKNILVFVLLFFSLKFISQTIVNCPSDLVYLIGNPIQVYNPSLPISASNPSSTTITGSGNGLALCDNLNGSTISPTFYTIIIGMYHYWNGSSWISTGHTPGAPGAVNLTGAGCYIYNLDGLTGNVYKYDGTSNGTFFMNVPGFSTGGPYDLSSDLDGNFYILRTDTNQWLRVYDFSGVLVNSFVVNGMPFIKAGGALAVLGNSVCVTNSLGLHTGVISGTAVNFSLTSTSVVAGDFANCPTMNTGTSIYGISNSGPLSCSGGTTSVMATGFPSGTTYNWAGPGLTGPATNSLVPVNMPGAYNCTITLLSGCTTLLSTSVASTGPLNITVNPPLTTICQGSSINLNASGAANYNWTGSNLSSSTGNSVTASPTITSTYTVVANTGNCSSAPKTITVNVVTCTGISELNNISNVSVYPNPSNGTFTIKASKELQINIVNDLGQIVRTVVVGKENNFETKVSDLNPGVYFLIEKNGGVVRDKIIVIKN